MLPCTACLKRWALHPFTLLTSNNLTLPISSISLRTSLALDSAWSPGNELPCIVLTHLCSTLKISSSVTTIQPSLHPAHGGSLGVWLLTHLGQAGLLRSLGDTCYGASTRHTTPQNLSCQVAISQEWVLQVGQLPRSWDTRSPGPQGLLVCTPDCLTWITLQ